MLAAFPHLNLNKSLLFNPRWGHLGSVPEGEASECPWAAGFGHGSRGGTGQGVRAARGVTQTGCSGPKHFLSLGVQ